MKKYLFLPFYFLSQLAAYAQSDTLKTDQGQIIITPVTHGSLVLQYNGKTIYVDPYGGAEAYEQLNDPDLVLITDIHGDHLDKETLEAIDLSQTNLIVPEAVKEKLGDMEPPEIETLKNGEQTEWENIRIEAIPMYNLPETADSRHPKGRGNGYILTIDDKRIYISGDTEDTPEMRALEDIDVAFISMNMPYTMDIDQAASGVLAFKPTIIYPYHYRGSDVEAFKNKVESQNQDIEVRLREWYD